MKSQILYASVIFTISTILMGASMFAVEAKQTDFENIIKGNGVQIDEFDSGLQLTIEPKVNSKEYFMTYTITTDYGLDVLEKAACTVTDKVVKISALKIASIQLNTGDAECESTGPSGTLTPVDISIKIVAYYEEEPFEFEMARECDDEEGKCRVTVGSEQTALGEAEVSVNGVDKVFAKDAGHTVKITKSNIMKKEWNQ